MQLLGQSDSRGWRDVRVQPNKSKYRNPKHMQNSNVSMIKTKNEGPAFRFACFGHLDFGNSDLFRASDF